MAGWLFDAAATLAAKSPQFQKPYKRNNWVDDMEWNQWPMDAMRHVTEADRVFSMPGENWGATEKAFYRNMMEGLENNA